MSTLSSRVKESNYLLGIMLDVDDFKKINDKYGHLAGDQAITAIGQILRNAIQGRRMIFRYAGDEFVIIMPINDLSEIAQSIEKIHTETENFREKNRIPYKLHLSAGYTIYTAGESPNAFIERMDSEMYKDKKANKER